MSTRRARIKAVASLPVRRKNTDNSNAGNNKPKPIEVQQSVEKVIQSPNTPQSFVAHNIEVKSPRDSFSSKVTEISKESSKAADEKIHEEPVFVAPNETVNKNITLPKTPKLSEKVSVITPTPLSKSQLSNVFISPIRRDSPVTKNVASPISPRVLSSLRSEVIHNDTSSHAIETSVLPCSKDAQSQETNLVPSSANKDYNPPSVPESVTDETGMDGIVPLHSTHSLPKPIAVLKDEIISENAEVLFDPIVPLPSPSKVRPKLRPAPRLNTIRRNSIQGSASESEDESRRTLLVGGGTSTPAPARVRLDSHTSHSTLQSAPNKEINRVRNDSVCSGISQATVQPLHAASPLKEKNVTKCRRQEASRRLAAMKRRREAVKRDTLTMYDLIFYNPTTNPLVQDKDESKEVGAKVSSQKANEVQEEEEEDEDDPPSESEAAPVPQITIGPNGEIILDKKSLVIQQTKSDRKLSSNVIHETYRPIGSGGRYTRQARTADWNAEETIRFYRALAAAGTDFTLMASLFPDRSRRDLKIKFKKEEKINGAQVDKALRSATTWDVLRLQQEFKEEREEARRKAEMEKERKEREQQEERERLKQCRSMGMRRSKAAKVLRQTVQDAAEEMNPGSTADQIIIRALQKNARNRKNQSTKQPKDNEQQSPQKALLTRSDGENTKNLLNIPSDQIATISRADPRNSGNFSSIMPKNFEIGSLVVLTVNDPKSPTKKMLQTYVAREGGTLAPVALPPTLLNTVVGYMKSGTPKSSASTSSSPHVLTPHSVVSNESRDSVSRTSVTSGTTSVIQMNPSPIKRRRLSSYTITQL